MAAARNNYPADRFGMILMNQDSERFFRDLTTQQLRRGVFTRKGSRKRFQAK